MLPATKQNMKRVLPKSLWHEDHWSFNRTKNQEASSHIVSKDKGLRYTSFFSNTAELVLNMSKMLSCLNFKFGVVCHWFKTNKDDEKNFQNTTLLKKEIQVQTCNWHFHFLYCQKEKYQYWRILKIGQLRQFYIKLAVDFSFLLINIKLFPSPFSSTNFNNRNKKNEIELFFSILNFSLSSVLTWDVIPLLHSNFRHW